MIKILLLSISLSMFLNAMTIATQGTFSNKLVGMQKSITNGTFASLKKFKRNQVQLAVVRGDILSNVYNGSHKFKTFTDYTVLAQMDDSYIYLVTKDFSISSIYDLRNKTVAVGDRNNLAASYLMRIAKKYGVSQEINTKAIGEIEAIKELNNGTVDAIFVFASKRYNRSLRGLDINNLPNDFITVLKKQSGLNKFRTRKGVSTIKASNFVIVSNDLDYDALFKVVKNLQKKRVKILKSLNPQIGILNSNISSILNEIQQDLAPKQIVQKKSSKKIISPNVVEKEDIEFKLIDSSLDGDKLQLYYHIINNTDNMINMKFDSIRTKSLDEYPFKVRHLFKINQLFLSIDKNSKKMFHVEVLRKRDISVPIVGEYVFKIENKFEQFKFEIDGVR